MKIKDLLKFNILDEMASTCLNKRIDDNFYDFYFEKGIDWLMKNKDKIINDFYSLDTTFEKENGWLFYTKKFSKQDVINILEEGE